MRLALNVDGASANVAYQRRLTRQRRLSGRIAVRLLRHVTVWVWHDRSALPVAELAGHRRNNDVLNIIVNRQIDSWLLHFDLLVATSRNSVFALDLSVWWLNR